MHETPCGTHRPLSARSAADRSSPIAAQRRASSPLLVGQRPGTPAGALQRQSVSLDEEEFIQPKLASPSVLLQAKAGSRSSPSAAPPSNRTGLPDTLKAGVERLSGLSLDHVRVHYNSSEPAQLNALAYARGSEIHVAPGQEKHLPHEAWHIVQQAQGRVKPTTQAKGNVPINDDQALEHEADRMGATAMQLKPSLPSNAVSTDAHSRVVSSSSAPVQKYSYTIGPLNNESGTKIKTKLIEPNDNSVGSAVSVWPSWWPTGSAETANDFLRENFIQGHLLNQKLGGPGDERYNLTPLTRSANSQMSASIENLAKSWLNNGNAIKYWVTADYSYHPTVAGVGAGHLPQSEKLKLQTSLDKMAGEIGAQITVYDATANGGWQRKPESKQPNDIYVRNEGSALKGSFV